MQLTTAIVIGGAAVNVAHPSDAYVAMTHDQSITALLLDEEGKVLQESTNADEVYHWPTINADRSAYE